MRNLLRKPFALLIEIAVLSCLLAYLINQLPAIPNFPYKSELIIGVSILVISLVAWIQFQQERQEASSPPASHINRSQLERQAYRNRQALLDKVHNSWIQGVLEQSLYVKARIELGLEERPEAVHPWGIEWAVPQQGRQMLPTGTKVIDKLDGLGEGATLLILGEPGAGKTTTLLELARDLIDRARRLDNQAAIPVVLNLSSWSLQKSLTQQAFVNWIVEELSSKYQIPKSLGQAWLGQEQLLLLLDGLDEVSLERRNACVDAINWFCQKHGTTKIVVCSRSKDYEALSLRLRFQASLFIQPLTANQIESYLIQVGEQLAGVRTALQTDPELQEADPNSLRKLAETPLFLWIISIAYKDTPASAIFRMGVTNQRQILFNEYIKSRLEAYVGYRRHLNQQYPVEKVKHWLHVLAQWMVEESQTVFLIERMQPSWLDTKRQRFYYQLIFSLLFILVNTLLWVVLGLGMWLTGGLIDTMLITTLFIGGLFWGVMGGLTGYLNEIQPIEAIIWSWKNAGEAIVNQKRFIVLLGILTGLKFWLEFSLSWELIVGLSWVLIWGIIIISFIGGLRSVELEEAKAYPNQGIWRSAIYLAGSGLIGGLLFFGLSWLANGPRFAKNGLFLGLFLGLHFGLIFAGGRPCFKHLALRLILGINSFIPLNYARFLDYMVECLFLQKVGGGYIFVHRLLMEHFANMTV